MGMCAEVVNDWGSVHTRGTPAFCGRSPFSRAHNPGTRGKPTKTATAGSWRPDRGRDATRLERGGRQETGHRMGNLATYDDDDDYDDYDIDEFDDLDDEDADADDYEDYEDEDADDDEDGDDADPDDFDYSFDFLPDDEDDDQDQDDDYDDDQDAPDDGDDWDDDEDDDDEDWEPDDADDDDDDADAPEVFDRSYVEKLRRENAQYRSRYQEARAETQEVLTPILEAVGNVLGNDFNVGDATAEDIAAALSDVPKRTAEQARVDRIEAAVYKYAYTEGVDAEAAMDSRSFYDAVTKLDPTADDFDNKVRDLLKQRPQTTGSRRSAPPARSGGDFTSGNRATNANDLDVAALQKRRRKRRGVN